MSSRWQSKSTRCRWARPSNSVPTICRDISQSLHITLKFKTRTSNSGARRRLKDRIWRSHRAGQGQRKPQALAFQETELGDTHKFLSLGTHRRPWFSRTMTGGTRGRVTSFLLSSWVNKGMRVFRTPLQLPAPPPHSKASVSP